MPRTRQGGPRGGTPGQTYPNRTDIQAQPNLPARAATGQTYGKAQSQLEAQAAVPMAPPRLALPQAPTTAQGGMPVSGGAPPQISQGPAPGALDLHRPTERPGEPVTAGAPVGAGPGPEALPPGPSNPVVNNNLSSLLASIADSTGSDAVRALAQHAQAAGQ